MSITINWASIPKNEQEGERGTSYWQSFQFEGLRMRLVEYSAGYEATHWYRKGHVIHCLEGEVQSKQDNGDIITLKQGMSYMVVDDFISHKSITTGGVKLMIIDGDFLKMKKD